LQNIQSYAALLNSAFRAAQTTKRAELVIEKGKNLRECRGGVSHRVEDKKEAGHDDRDRDS
jgi:hypothetical protein